MGNLSIWHTPNVSAAANISLWGSWASCFCHLSRSKPYVVGANLMTLPLQYQRNKISFSIMRYLKFFCRCNGDIPAVRNARLFHQLRKIRRPFCDNAAFPINLLQVCCHKFKDFPVDVKFLSALDYRFPHPDLLRIHTGDFPANGIPFSCSCLHISVQKIICFIRILSLSLHQSLLSCCRPVPCSITLAVLYLSDGTKMCEAIRLPDIRLASSVSALSAILEKTRDIRLSPVDWIVTM